MLRLRNKKINFQLYTFIGRPEHEKLHNMQRVMPVFIFSFLHENINGALFKHFERPPIKTHMTLYALFLFKPSPAKKKCI